MDTDLWKLPSELFCSSSKLSQDRSEICSYWKPWPYSTNWGYYPTGVCGLLVTAIATLVVVGRL